MEGRVDNNENSEFRADNSPGYDSDISENISMPVSSKNEEDDCSALTMKEQKAIFSTHIDENRWSRFPFIGKIGLKSKFRKSTEIFLAIYYPGSLVYNRETN